MITKETLVTGGRENSRLLSSLVKELCLTGMLTMKHPDWKTGKS